MNCTYMYKLVQIPQFKVQDLLLSENKPKSFDLITYSLYFKRVPEEGLEPSRHYWQRILSPYFTLINKRIQKQIVSSLSFLIANYLPFLNIPINAKENDTEEKDSYN